MPRKSGAAYHSGIYGLQRNLRKEKKLEKKEALGFEVKRMSNMIMNFIGSEMTKAGFDEITVTHGWILGWLRRHRDQKQCG